MPARNIYHDVVVAALRADGWTITDDPFRLTYGGKDLYVDLGAERVTIGAVRGEERIAVEVQSFLNRSATYDLHAAVGQFVVYRAILKASYPERVLYLAVSEDTFDRVFADRLGQLIITDVPLRMLIFDQMSAKVVQWIN